MAHIHSQTAAQAESQGVPSESSLDLEDSDNSKDGTCSGGGSVSDTLCSMSPNSFITEKSELTLEAEDKCDVAATAFVEDTSCAVKKKKMPKSRKENKVLRDSRSECRTIKGGAWLDSAVSCDPTELEEGCATLNLATTMERVNPDLYAFGRSGSPYPSSENDWEASDHSDTDADHSDSSDDDNPTSQVDRMIERGARLIMDGENSNLSSETDDTSDDDDEGDFDDESDSDITDVSPLVSNAASPLGLSPVMARRNILPSSTSCPNNRPAFVRHYSHRGHDGDVEDEADEENHSNHHHLNPHWSEDHQDNAASNINAADMSLVVQALLKFGIDSRKTSRDNTSLDSENQNLDCNTTATTHGIRNRQQQHHHMSPALQANPHHRHLRKNSHSRRKNMSFTNEEVRIINRDNSIILEKLLAVSNRPEDAHSNPNYRQAAPKPAPATINRRRQEEGIRKDNLGLLRRLQEVKPSRAVTASRNSTSAGHHTSTRHHHHHHHHHSSSSKSSKHHNHYQQAASCSATARQSPFSPPHHHHHHSPKETAL